VQYHNISSPNHFRGKSIIYYKWGTKNGIPIQGSGSYIMHLLYCLIEVPLQFLFPHPRWRGTCPQGPQGLHMSAPRNLNSWLALCIFYRCDQHRHRAIIKWRRSPSLNRASSIEWRVSISIPSARVHICKRYLPIKKLPWAHTLETWQRVSLLNC